MIRSGKKVQAFPRTDPPFAAAGLQRNALPNPAEVGYGFGLEPVEARTVETTEPPMETRRLAAQDVEGGPFEDAGPRVAEYCALEAHVARPILEDRPHLLYAIAFTVGAKPRARQLHGPGRIRAEPQVAVEVFTERVDFEVTQPVRRGVGMEETALCIAGREELHQAPGRRNPEPMVGGFEKLEHENCR